ncbi:MAG: hypothetical protein ED559_06930 [Phycisphaera sp.]|nr:MAG: hypothetical protein ED559_06930 [Phycisphaera sp.]
MKRSGFVIFVVLIAVIAMAAGLSAMLSGIRGQSDAVRAIVDRQEARLAARSAALAIGSELEDQLDEMLAGEMPTLSETEDVIQYEDDSSWRWQIDSSGEEWDGIEPLGIRVDVNHTNEEIIAAIEQNDGEPGSIASQRPYRTFGMIQEEVTDSELLSVLTVSSIDPPLRTGAGGQLGEVGQARLKPGTGGVVPVGISADGVRLFDEIAGGSLKLSNRALLFRTLVGRSIPTEDWDILLDVFVFSSESGSRGMIDLARAPESVLAALPGVDEEAAASLVDHREGLNAQDLAGLSWPVRDGVIELEEYMQCVDLLTSRSMQYLVRFRVDREVYESVNASLGYEVAEDLDPPIYCGYDMVIDLSSGRARVAYLRDITFEPWTQRVGEAPSSESAAEETVIELPEDINVFSSDIQPNSGRREEDDPVESGKPAEDGAGVQWGRYPAGGQG